MDEPSKQLLTGQRAGPPSAQCGSVPQISKPVEETRDVESDSSTHSLHEVHRHPIGAGVGALLAAGTGGATGGVLGGPVGAVVGAVIGAIAGSYGGNAIAELADSVALDATGQDDYTRRVHCPGLPSHADEPQDSTIPANIKQAPRETWSWLDQTPKELLTGETLPPSDS